MRLDSGLALRVGSWLARAVAAPASTLLNGLVSYWPLDEVSGTRADAVGDNDLTDNNTVGVAYPGPSGTVASFVSADSTKLTKASAEWDTPPFSYVYWAKSTDAAPNDYRSPFGEISAGAGISACYVTNAGVTSAVVYSRGITGNAAVTVASPTLWHMVYVEQLANGSVTIEINAGEDSDTAGTGTYQPISNIQIGSSTASGAHWNGPVGPVGIWSRVLTEAERTSLFNSGAGKAYADLTTAEKVGLVSYWNLDETSDGSGAVTRVDAHGDNDLTDNGTTASATNTATMHNAAASFVAANSENLTRESAQFGLTNKATWAWWQKKANASGDQTILSKWTHGTATEWAFQVNDTTGAMAFYVAPNSNDGGTVKATQSGSAITLDAWQSVILVYDGEGANNDARLKFYLDNELKSFSWDGTCPTSLQDLSAAILSIGSFTGAVTRYNSGLVDEVAIWSRVLSEAERTELYNAGAGVYYNGSDFV